MESMPASSCCRARGAPPAAACRRLLALPPGLTSSLHDTTADAQRSWVALLEKGLDFEIRKVGYKCFFSSQSAGRALCGSCCSAAGCTPRRRRRHCASPGFTACAAGLQVDLANKDAEFVSTYHSINPDESAPAKVPILLDGDVRLVESGVIVGEWKGAQGP